MAKKYSLAALAALFIVLLSSCSKDREAQKPVYISVPKIFLNTDYQTEGTSSNKITTVWIVANGNPVGVFELPCTVPALLNEGNNEITLYPGINLNGITSSRAIYESFEPMEFTLNYSPSGKEVADTMVVDSVNRTTSYMPRFTIDLVEDFDGSGLNLEKTNRSDTNARKTSDSSEIFINYQNLSENNGSAGVVYVNKSKDFAELATVKSYSLPIGGSNVYLEMNYKCNIPFIVGVISDGLQGTVQQPTLLISPKADWNKIYVNLVTEISSQSSSATHKVFFLIEHRNEYGVDTGKVYLDNLKLVYGL